MILEGPLAVFASRMESEFTRLATALEEAYAKIRAQEHVIELLRGQVDRLEDARGRQLQAQEGSRDE